MDQAEYRGRGWGSLIGTLAVTGVVSAISFNRHSGTSQLFPSVWLLLIAPWVIWFWWILRGRFTGYYEYEDISSTWLDRCYRFRGRAVVWLLAASGVIWAAILLRSDSRVKREEAAKAAESALSHENLERFIIMSELLGISDRIAQLPPPPTPNNGEPGESDPQDRAYQREFARIAAAHKMSVAELEAISRKLFEPLPDNRPFRERHAAEVWFLLLDGLLILNMPVYWGLAALMYGDWSAYREEFLDALRARRRERLDYWGVWFHALLFLAIVGSQLGLLYQFVS